MAVQNASSGKSHRFAPTRELHADYNTIVPATDRDRKYTRELREFLKRSDEDVGERIINGSMYLYPLSLLFRD